jgi:hypothetical protein
LSAGEQVVAVLPRQRDAPGGGGGQLVLRIGQQPANGVFLEGHRRGGDPAFGVGRDQVGEDVVVDVVVDDGRGEDLAGEGERVQATLAASLWCSTRLGDPDLLRRIVRVSMDGSTARRVKSNGSASSLRHGSRRQDGWLTACWPGDSWARVVS